MLEINKEIDSSGERNQKKILFYVELFNNENLDLISFTK
jgi:hypothetical protein